MGGCLRCGGRGKDEGVPFVGFADLGLSRGGGDPKGCIWGGGGVLELAECAAGGRGPTVVDRS